MNSKSNLTLDSSRVATLERALAILAVFETSETPVTLAQISQATGLYKSTILRLIASFEDHGYIQRSADGLTYTVGPTAYRLGMTYKKSFELDKAVENTLEELVSKGTESASFHVIDRDHRMCVLRVDSNHPTLDRVAAGDRLPLNRGAAGKILRAFTGESTPEMEAVRDNGIAVSQGEVDPSCAAISVPVFGLSNELIGAISVSGPKERFTAETVESMSQLLFEASRKLSKLAVAERRVRTLPLRA